MAYDYMGRRFEYKETVNNTLTRHERYLYRGYLQIAALDLIKQSGNNAIRHCIIWDPTEPTATRPLALQVGANACFYSFDQVKNVAELFDSSGALAAAYDYAPFGGLTFFRITQSGNNAITQFSNPLTFSSEIHDSTLGLQYYNYRYLNLLDGRWVNRDPIGENAFRWFYIRSHLGAKYYKAILMSSKPMYELCGNCPVDEIDLFGLTNDPGDFGGPKFPPGYEYIPDPPPANEDYASFCCKVSLWWNQNQILQNALQDASAARSKGIFGPNRGPEDAIRHCSGGCHLARFMQNSRACREDSVDKVIVKREEGDPSPAMDIANGIFGAKAPSGTSCFDYCVAAFYARKLIFDTDWMDKPGNIPSIGGGDDRL
jgi:RHS repeat-associated protein